MLLHHARLSNSQLNDSRSKMIDCKSNYLQLMLVSLLLQPLLTLLLLLLELLLPSKPH